MITYSAKYLGRKAFETRGMSSLRGHDFPARSAQHQEWLVGFDDARMASAGRSLSAALAYHTLSVRDNAKDREWAAKFAARKASN